MNSGQISMCCEGPLEVFQSLLNFPIPSSGQTLATPRRVPEGDMSQAKFSEDVLMESGAFGGWNRLFHKSVSKNLPVVEPLCGLQGRVQELCEQGADRRSNIGNFQRILVAEHHKGTRRMLLQMLRKWGFDVVPATTGAEALQIVEQSRPPELIILSRTLPDIDIFELCRQLTDRHGDYAPYILVLAMEGDQREIVRALEAGAAEYLATPFEAQELRARLSVAVRILKRQESLITSRDNFRVLATRDTLTGVWNRRSIDLILEEELTRATNSERATGVLLVDLDHFKKVNDTHGHSAGDCVLREASRRLQGILRAYDSIGRYGGEEFLIVVPASAEGELRQLAERLRKAVEEEPVRVGEAEIRITLSIGAVIAPPRESSSSDAIAMADAALYDAKRFGRNRSVYRGQGMETATQLRSHNLSPIRASSPLP